MKKLQAASLRLDMLERSGSVERQLREELDASEFRAARADAERDASRAERDEALQALAGGRELNASADTTVLIGGADTTVLVNGPYVQGPVADGEGEEDEEEEDEDEEEDDVLMRSLMGDDGSSIASSPSAVR